MSGNPYFHSKHKIKYSTLTNLCPNCKSKNIYYDNDDLEEVSINLINNKISIMFNCSMCNAEFWKVFKVEPLVNILHTYEYERVKQNGKKN